MKLALLIAAAYLLGSVPFGVIIARLHGKDLRKIGSGNIGATNLSRALGKKWGYICFILDLAKGLVPMLIAAGIVAAYHGPGELFAWLLVGIAAVLGHVFPIYLKFRGGKGVATSFGVALGLWPYFTICAALALVAWIVVVLIWRYISLASIVASVVFPFALAALTITVEDWKFTNLWPIFIAAVGIPIMVIFRHRDNVRRILAGTESKIFSK
jgi:glycerol-3-phosphate acyltransferase PlsY